MQRGAKPRTHKDILTSVNNLGLLHLLQDQGKLEEAEPLFREAMDGRRGPSGRHQRAGGSARVAHGHWEVAFVDSFALTH